MIYHVLAALIHTCIIDNLRPTPETILVNEGTKMTMSFQSFVVSAKLAAQGKVTTVESISLGSAILTSKRLFMAPLK